MFQSSNFPKKAEGSIVTPKMVGYISQTCCNVPSTMQLNRRRRWVRRVSRKRRPCHRRRCRQQSTSPQPHKREEEGDADDLYHDYDHGNGAHDHHRRGHGQHHAGAADDDGFIYPVTSLIILLFVLVSFTKTTFILTLARIPTSAVYK